MKNLIFAAVILLFSFTSNVEASSNIASRVGGYFHASLSPHGTWIDIGYGAIAWKPTIMVRTWQPYYHGRWIWSDYGWYWDSYEPYGHIVYHYGRWYYDDYYGWIWIPDYEWAPAWVEWRYTDSYIGWAPLSPYGVFSIAVGIHFTHNYYIHHNNWHYVHVNNFCSPYVTNYYVGDQYKYRIHSKTKHRTNYTYYNGRVRNNGIDVSFVEKRSGQKIRQRNIQTFNDPGKVVYDRKRDLERDNIRTFYADKNELSRENLRDIEVKRSDRNTSLDLSRVELGSTRDLDKDKIRKERSVEQSRTGNREENEKEVTRQRNVDNERKVTDDRKTDVRTNRSDERVNTRETNVRKDSGNRTETEVKRNVTTPVQKRNVQETQRNDTRVNQNNSNNEVKTNENVQKKIEPRVIQQEQKKVQVNNNTRNTEVKTERRETTQPKVDNRKVEKPTQRETRVETQRKNDSGSTGRDNSNSDTRDRRR